jgi:hypothetical protein
MTDTIRISRKETTFPSLSPQQYFDLKVISFGNLLSLNDC